MLDFRGFGMFLGRVVFCQLSFLGAFLARSLHNSQLLEVLRVHFPHGGSVAGCIPGHNT